MKPRVITPASLNDRVAQEESESRFPVRPSSTWSQPGDSIAGLIRPLLEALAKLAGLECTYLVVFDWRRREQEVRFVYSASEALLQEGDRIPVTEGTLEEA